MPHFIYTSKKIGGELHKGEHDAKDRYELYRIIKDSGEEVVSVQEKNPIQIFKKFSLAIFSSIKTQEKINFTRSLGAMIKAGLSVSQALSVIERQGANKVVKKIVTAVNNDIRQGKTMSDAMKSYPNMFSPLMIAMIHSGEESGTMGEALRIVTLQMDKSHTLSRRVRGALMYPGVILSAMVLISIVLLTYVVPTLTKTFGELNITLPALTRFVIWISDSIKLHGITILLSTLLLSSLIYFWSKRENGRYIIDRIILHIPLIGGLIQEVNVARTARTLSSLIQSDVDVLEALRITADILQNVHYKKVIEKASVSVEKGESLSKVFSENVKLYPVFLSEMISVGEETGKIGEMLLGVATYFEDDVDQKTKDMSTIIEPFLMIVIGIVVGFFAFAMISPMYSLVNVI